MSTLVKSLKKQIELLQSEVELYADAVDRLAAQLEPFLQAQEQTIQVDTSPMSPMNKSIDASKVEAGTISITTSEGDLTKLRSIDLAD